MPGCGEAQSRIVTVPAVAVDPQPVAGLDSLRCARRSDDSRKAEFPRDDGRMAHDAADIGDRRRRSCRRPASSSETSTARRGSRPLPARRAGRLGGSPVHGPRPRPGKPQARRGRPCGRRSARQPLLDALVGDAPEHDRHRIRDRLGYRPRTAGGAHSAHRVVDRLPRGHDRRPVARAPRRPGAARAPEPPSSSSAARTSSWRRIEDILRIREESLPGQERAELPHLVPEDRAEPVLDVEVVALDEGEDGASKLEALVEGLPCLLRESRERCSSVTRSRSAITASRGREMSSPAPRRSMYEPIIAIGRAVSSIHDRWWW